MKAEKESTSQDSWERPTRHQPPPKPTVQKPAQQKPTSTPKPAQNSKP